MEPRLWGRFKKRAMSAIPSFLSTTVLDEASIDCILPLVVVAFVLTVVQKEILAVAEVVVEFLFIYSLINNTTHRTKHPKYLYVI